MLAVVAVIAILVGIVLSTVGYVQAKGAQSRANAEIQSLATACEAYKTDYGIYPVSVSWTNTLNPKTNGDSTDAGTLGSAAAPISGNYPYQNSSLYLYTVLTGDTNCTGLATVSYFPIKPTMCYRPSSTLPISNSNTVRYLMDPWGNSYGYSTAAAQVSSSNGYNPTFDLWSTGGTVTTGSAPTNTVLQWVKNW